MKGEKEVDQRSQAGPSKGRTAHSRRAKVLQFAATHGGGIATHVTALSQGLSPAKYDVRVLCPDTGELGRRLRGLGIEFDAVPVATELDLAGDLRLLAFLAGYLRRHRFDLVHAHSTKAGFWGRIVAWLCGVPVVVYTAHAYRFLRYPVGSPGWLAYVAAEWVAGRFGSTIAVGPSEGTLTQSLRLTPRPRRFVVNNGVPMPEGARLSVDPTIRMRLGIPQGCPMVLTIGRLMRQKAPLTFVDVAAEVARRVNTAVFVIVGDGELEEAVRARAAAHGIVDRLHIIPHTEEIPALLLETDVFVMTSLYEGLSYAAAEAGVYGRAMVLSDVPGLRDLVLPERTGLLARPNDARSFADAIVHLLEDGELRRSFGAAAARFVGANFNVEAMVRDTERVYDSLLGASRS